MEHTRTAHTAVLFDEVTKRYGALTALDGVTFDISQGETIALLGPNGAGKSSALGILLGLRSIDAGRVEVLGEPPRRAITAGRVGAMLQTGGLAPGAKVIEVVDLVRRLYPRPRRTDELLEVAGLTHVAGRRVEGLSGGEAQRVRMAMALAGQPDLVILDEPTVALDVEGRRAFWATMRAAAAAGTTVIFATHYLEEADAVADRVIVLAGGHLVADGTASAIRAAARTRTIRATIPGATKRHLEALPDVVEVLVHGDDVTIRSSDADATLHALYRADIAVIKDVAVAGAGLEEAFLALTHPNVGATV